MSEITRVGADLAKRVIQVHAADLADEAKKWTTVVECWK